MLSGKGFTLGRVFGIEITLDYSWFVIFILFAWMYSGMFYSGDSIYIKTGVGIFAALLFFASVLFHELTHAFVAKSFKIPVPKIELFFLGGAASVDIDSYSEKPEKEFAIAFAGPLSSVFLGLVTGSVLLLTRDPQGGLGNKLPEFWDGFLSYFALIQFVLAGFNMLPAFPLDGGRVFRSILWKIIDNRKRATRIAVRVGQFFGRLMMAVGIYSLVALFVPSLPMVASPMFLLLGWFVIKGAEGSWVYFILVTSKVREVLVFRDLEGRTRSAQFAFYRTRMSCSLDDSVERAMEIMGRQSRAALDVTENGHVIDLISAEDIVRFLAAEDL